MPNYGDQKYWEDRYKSQNGNTFDWLEDYETLKDLIDYLKLDKCESRILNLGCGNAELEEKMYIDGYKNIFNIDIAENVINFKQKRNTDRKGLICNKYN